MSKIYLYITVVLSAFFAAPLAYAHEAYVMPLEQFHAGLEAERFNIFNALKDPSNLKMFLGISVAVFLALVCATIFQRMYGRKVSLWLTKWQRYAQLILRVALGAALLFGALSGNFLGPEIALADISSMPFLRLALILASFLIISGFMSEIGALVALGTFLFAIPHNGWYLMSYVSYLAEMIALIIFGPGAFSLDSRLNISRVRFSRFKENEVFLVRLGYGVALMFSAISIKFLHPALTLSVINDYHLTDFHLLFPPDPMLALLGGALAELTIGFFVLIGFQTRLVVAVSLFYITLSLLFFNEAVWPHLILYGLAFYLLLSPQKLAVDNLIER
jgi:uncharacterized membrane protein YphA (DoxX/SURF4 family)